MGDRLPEMSDQQPLPVESTVLRQLPHFENNAPGVIIQVGNDNNATIDYKTQVKGLIDKVKESLPQILDESKKMEVNADVATVEAQLQSAHPKTSIISDCFRSIKPILETVGSTLATSLAGDLAKHIFR
jgi:hypothetical protein